MRNDDAANPLRKFLREEYLDKGAALFGRETPESLDDFRKAAGGALDRLNDVQVKRIVHGSVQRIRNWAHIGSLHQAGFELARYVAILDAKTTEICESIDGKMLRVGTAYQRVTELTKLAPGDFAAVMYESTVAREYQKNPAAWILQRITDDIVDDDALLQNIGLPPLHIGCRTRVEGVFDELGGKEPAIAPASPESSRTELTAQAARTRLGDIEKNYQAKREALETELAKSRLRAYEASGERRQLLADEVERQELELAQLNRSRLNEMHALLAVNEPVKFDLKFEGRVSKAVKAIATEGVKLFQRLVSNDALAGRTLTVKATASRAHQVNELIALTPRNTVPVVVHEIGHWLEQHSPDVLAKIIEFFERRTKDEKEQQLADLFPGSGYKRTEKTKKDDFLHAYMGKVYRNLNGKIWATELVSMGLEEMARDPYRLARFDSELFDLIYEIARMKKDK